MRDHARSGALTEVTFFILLSVYEPRHGYAIMQFVEQETHGRLILGAGSLYGALSSLAKKGYIEPQGEDGERRKQYRITQAGRQVVKRELARLKEITQTAEAIVGAVRPAAGSCLIGENARSGEMSAEISPQGWEAEGIG